jgi:hypothetical protein
MILLASLDAYVFELAGQGGRTGSTGACSSVMLDRMRIVEGRSASSSPSASTGSSSLPWTSDPTQYLAQPPAWRVRHRS